MTKNFQIVIVGTDYEPNFGDQAIFATMVQNLRENIPNCELMVHSQNPKGTQRLIGKYLLSHESIRQAIINNICTSNFDLQNLRTATIVEQFEEQKEALAKSIDTTDISKSDGLILVGGGSKIAEGEKDAIFNLFYLALAKQCRKPVILYSQSVGPWRSRRFKRLVKHVLRQSDLILLRERFSRRLLQRLGVENRVLVSVPDSAFRLRPQKNISEILDKQHLKEIGRPLIGICAGGRSTDQKVNDRYCRVMAAVADHLIAEYNAKIVFIHTRGRMSPGYPDDKESSRMIASSMRRKDREIIEDDYDCEILSGIIARFDLLISYRMHGLVFALSNGVPIVPISMYYKTKGTLLWAEYPIKDINIGKVTEKRLIRLASTVMRNRRALQEHILRRAPFLEREVIEKSKLIRKAIVPGKP